MFSRCKQSRKQVNNTISEPTAENGQGMHNQSFTRGVLLQRDTADSYFSSVTLVSLDDTANSYFGSGSSSHGGQENVINHESNFSRLRRAVQDLKEMLVQPCNAHKSLSILAYLQAWVHLVRCNHTVRQKRECSRKKFRDTKGCGIQARLQEVANLRNGAVKNTNCKFCVLSCPAQGTTHAKNAYTNAASHFRESSQETITITFSSLRTPVDKDFHWTWQNTCCRMPCQQWHTGIFYSPKPLFLSNFTSTCKTAGCGSWQTAHSQNLSHERQIALHVYQNLMPLLDGHFLVHSSCSLQSPMSHVDTVEMEHKWRD